MDVKTVYAQENGKVTVVCEQCGYTRVFTVSDVVQVAGQPRRVRCRCKHEFFISIEVRKFYRKHTQLPGEYCLRSAQTSIEQEQGAMTVEDVSMSGLKFRTEGQHSLQVDDTIDVKFTLDNTQRSEVSQRAVVKRVDDQCVSAAFIDLAAYRRLLGYYLRP